MDAGTLVCRFAIQLYALHASVIESSPLSALVALWMSLLRSFRKARWPAFNSSSHSIRELQPFHSTACIMAQVESAQAIPAAHPAKRVKLTGRAFYESIGSPKMIVAPMVDRSEFVSTPETSSP